MLLLGFALTFLQIHFSILFMTTKHMVCTTFIFLHAPFSVFLFCFCLSVSHFFSVSSLCFFFFSCIHAYRHSFIVVVPENQEDQQGILEIWIASQSFKFCNLWGKKPQKTPQQTGPFRFLPRVAEAFWTGTYQHLFGMCCACMKDRNMEICTGKCSVCMWKTWSGRSFFEISQREHSTKLQAEYSFRTQGAICRNVLCEKESIAESSDCAPVKPPPAKNWHFKSTIKSGLLSPLTRQVTLGWTLKFVVLLWNDWTGGQ